MVACSVIANFDGLVVEPAPCADGGCDGSVQADGSLADDGGPMPMEDAGPLPDATASTDAGPDAPCVDSCNAPILLASGSAPAYVAVNQTHVYYTDSSAGTIRRVPIGGGSPQTIASGELSPWVIAIDASYVYWTSNEAYSSVGQATLDGGMKSPLAPMQPYPRGVAVDSSYVYWSNESGNDAGPAGVVRAFFDGGGLLQVAVAAEPKDVVAAAGYVYWADATAGTVNRALSDGTMPTTIASGESSPWGLAVSNGRVFWTNYTATGTVKSKALAALGAAPTVHATGQHAPRAVVADANSVYWTNEDDGTIRKAALTAGARVITLVAGEQAPHGIALDATYVYYAAHGGGRVMKVLK